MKSTQQACRVNEVVELAGTQLYIFFFPHLVCLISWILRTKGDEALLEYLVGDNISMVFFCLATSHIT